METSSLACLHAGIKYLTGCCLFSNTIMNHQIFTSTNLNKSISVIFSYFFSRDILYSIPQLSEGKLPENKLRMVEDEGRWDRPGISERGRYTSFFHGFPSVPISTTIESGSRFGASAWRDLKGDGSLKFIERFRGMPYE